jgi:hypothetical protein
MPLRVSEKMARSSIAPTKEEKGYKLFEKLKPAQNVQTPIEPVWPSKKLNERGRNEKHHHGKGT